MASSVIINIIGGSNPEIPHSDDEDSKEDTNKQNIEENDTHENKLLEKAALHIDDGIRRRGSSGLASCQEEGVPNYRKRCAFWVFSQRIRYLLCCVAIVHSALLFGEPKQANIPVGGMHTAIIIIHGVCLIFYIIDCAVTMTFYSCKKFWLSLETAPKRVSVSLTLLFAIDYIILLVEHCLIRELIAPFRCMRMIMLICYSHSLWYIFYASINVFTKLVNVSLAFGAFLYIFSCTGIHILRNYYHYIECVNTTTNCSDSFTPEKGSFDNIGVALMRLFGTLTTENYPGLMIPAYDKSPAYVAFFGIYIFLGNFILLAILLAIIVDNYWATVKTNVKQTRKRERIAFVKAWNIIVPPGCKELDINDKRLIGVFRILRPNITDNDCKEIAKYIDLYGEGTISSYNWTTRLSDALSYDYILDDLNTFTKNEKLAFEKMSKVQHALRKFVSHRAYGWVIVILIAIYGVLFGLHWYGMSTAGYQIIHYIRTAIVIWFLVDLVVIFLTRTPNECRKKPQILDIIFICFAACTNFFWYITISDPAHTELYPGLMITLTSLFTIARLPLHLKPIGTAMKVFIKISPVLIAVFFIMLAVMYFYAAIGLEAFYGMRKPSESEGVSSVHFEYNCGLGFDTFGCCWLEAFQILFTNDWPAIQQAVILSADTYWVALYFISMYVILNIFLMNLLVATAIESYKIIGKNKRDEMKSDTGKETRYLRFWINEDFNFEKLDTEPAFNRNRRKSLFEANIHRRHSIPPRKTLETVDSETETDEDAMDMSEEERRHYELEKRRKKRRKQLHSQRFKVVRPYRKKKENEITLHVDDEVEVLEHEGDFTRGVARGKSGWFPANCIEEIRRSPITRSAKDNDVLIYGCTSNPGFEPDSELMSRSSIKRKRTKATWTKDIVGDITVMNPDEAFELNQIISAPLEVQAQNDNDLRNGSVPGKRIKDDWKKKIVGDMTVMNDSEIFELNQIFHTPMAAGGTQKHLPSVEIPERRSGDDSESLLINPRELQPPESVPVINITESTFIGDSSSESRTQDKGVDLPKPPKEKVEPETSEIPAWAQIFLTQQQTQAKK